MSEVRPQVAAADVAEEVVSAFVRELGANYVYPEVGEAVGATLRQRLEAGEYADLGPAELADRLTADARDLSRDQHLRVYYRPDAPRQRGEEPAGWLAAYRERGAGLNYGVERVERLAGNVGLLELREFYPPDLGGEAVAAAMTLLARADALIVDVRRNGGGSPAMVAFASSYLFDAEPVHLNDFYSRPGDCTQQFWTQGYVPGQRYGAHKPVWVLTSRRTFSGGEEFAYNLQCLGRATLVGETTAGGAHPSGIFQLHQHFDCLIPTGRPINPTTGRDWEAVGVTPDIQVSASAALDTAHAAALHHLLGQLEHPGGESTQRLADEARQALAKLGS